MKKLFSLILCLCLILGVFAGLSVQTSAATSGYQGSYSLTIGSQKTIYANTSGIDVQSCLWDLEDSGMYKYVQLYANGTSCGVEAIKYYDYSITLSCTIYYWRETYVYGSSTPIRSLTSIIQTFQLTINEPPKVTVTFNANGGTSFKDSVSVYKGSSVGDLPTASRDGYDFNGWYTSSSGGSAVSSSTTVDSNTTFYAHWTKIVYYTVKFNPNGGSVSKTSVSVKGGSSIGSMPTPTRDGYTFDGWFTQASGGAQKTSSSTVNSDMTLYAHWTPNIVITYNANGGSVSPSSVTIKQGGSISSLPTPTRTDYFFDGWYTAASGGNNVTTSTTFSAKTTIYAHWIAGIKITFNPNGGSVSPKSAVIKPGSSVGALPEPTRSGCYFTGWYTAASGGNNVTTSTTFSAAATIYAHWEEGVKITLNPNGGSVTPGYIFAKTNAAIGELPEPVRSGYSFDGWYTTADGNVVVTASSSFSESSVIYAHWLANVKVTYNANGGTVTPEIKTLKKGDRIGALPTPSRDGYYFDGWYSTPTGDVKINDYDIVSKNITIYAHWIKGITISFDPAGGKINQGDESRIIKPGTAVGNLPSVSRSGYTFLRWCDENRITVSSSTVFSKNTEVYAVWKTTQGGFTYDFYPDGTARVYSYSGSDKFIAVPEQVDGYKITEITDSVFKNNKSIQEVFIPEGVVTIGISAFSGCTALTKVTMADSITKIGASAFLNCSALSKCNIPAGLKRLESSAFSGCSALMRVTFPEGVEYVGTQAMSGTRWLSEQPNGTVYIGKALYLCKGTGPASVEVKDGTIMITENAFKQNSSLKSVTFPETLKLIDYGAFCDCSGLTFVSIPDSVTEIGKYSFANCRNLQSVKLPKDIEEIKDSAFYSSGLTSLNLPSKLKTISTSAFEGCNLTDVTIPDSVTVIGSYAFYGNKNMKSITVPDRVETIGSYAMGYETTTKKLSGFTVYGYDDTYAQDYADAKYLTFVSLGEKPVRPCAGDVNGDKIVNNRDAMILDRYIAGWAGYGDRITDMGTADLNRDGVVNNRDAMMLDRYIAGWEGFGQYIVSV